MTITFELAQEIYAAKGDVKQLKAIVWRCNNLQEYSEGLLLVYNAMPGEYDEWNKVRVPYFREVERFLDKSIFDNRRFYLMMGVNYFLNQPLEMNAFTFDGTDFIGTIFNKNVTFHDSDFTKSIGIESILYTNLAFWDCTFTKKQVGNMLERIVDIGKQYRRERKESMRLILDGCQIIEDGENFFSESYPFLNKIVDSLPVVFDGEQHRRPVLTADFWKIQIEENY